MQAEFVSFKTVALMGIGCLMLLFLALVFAGIGLATVAYPTAQQIALYGIVVTLPAAALSVFALLTLIFVDIAKSH